MKISISLPNEIVAFLDSLVVDHRFPNRSKALARATYELQKVERDRQYEKALRKLDSKEEKTIADSFIESDSAWPKY